MGRRASTQRARAVAEKRALRVHPFVDPGSKHVDSPRRCLQSTRVDPHALFCVDARRPEGGRAGSILKLEIRADTVVLRHDMPLGTWATEGAAAVPHAKPSRIDLDFKTQA